MQNEDSCEPARAHCWDPLQARDSANPWVPLEEDAVVFNTELREIRVRG